MSPKRIRRVESVGKMRRVRKASALNVTRAEFDAVIKRLNARGEIVNELRRQLRTTCEALETKIHDNRRELQTQFARMAQLQQEIDALKRRG